MKVYVVMQTKDNSKDGDYPVTELVAVAQSVTAAVRVARSEAGPGASRLTEEGLPATWISAHTTTWIVERVTADTAIELLGELAREAS